MAFKLSKDSLRDLEEAVAYLAEDSVDAALNLTDDLESAFHFLTQWPLAGHRRSDLTRSSLRFWTVAEYLIAYRPRPRPLTIIAVLHGSRDVAAILKDRLH